MKKCLLNKFCSSRVRDAFTLIELSVVIVILSLLIGTVLVSRNLIESAKINKIQEEYRAMRTAVSLFYDTYSCMPGDCNANQIPDLIGLGLGGGGASSTCVASTVQVNTGSIDTAIKRTCMMHSLQLAGHINGVDPTYSTASNLADSISSKNIPYAKFSRQSSVDYREAVNAVSAGTNAIVPVEVGAAGGSLASLAGRHLMIVRNSNLVVGPTADIISGSKALLPAVTAAMASKLDLKFDDGRPYTGMIVAGKDKGAGNNATVCTNIDNTTLTPANITSAASYLAVNDMSKGCYVAYVIDV